MQLQFLLSVAVGITFICNDFSLGVFSQTVDDIFPDEFDEFSINSSDVMVFLHIQKTGGTYFGHKLVRSLDLPTPCTKIRNSKRSQCDRSSTNNSTWLFSRYSTGWKCGLHADWTELNGCVSGKIGDNHSLFYITGLRDPIKRFVSEWSHTKRDGSVWRETKYTCEGKRNRFKKCYPRERSWKNVSLAEFMACPTNMAFNRQTRMLANLSLVGCYDLWMKRGITEERRNSLEEVMLSSAKENLMAMPYFYLLERMVPSQKMFEEIFRLKFMEDFVQLSSGRSSTAGLSGEERQQIIQKNYLDVRLYEFASELFSQRLQYLGLQT